MDNHHFDMISKQITDLKEVNKREQQKKEMVDVIKQDVLVEIKGRKPHRLTDCTLIQRILNEPQKRRLADDSEMID